MILQRTLKNRVQATGVGVHSGDKVFITLRPAQPDTGIVFRRVDLDKPVDIPAKSMFIGSTDLCTSLSRDGVHVSTVEHLMSAFAGLGIDNAYVDLSAAEVPIMDGSAGPFVFLIQSAGIEIQKKAKKFIKIKKRKEVSLGDKRLLVEPYNGFRACFNIDFRHPMFTEDNQQVCFDFSKQSYEREIARARTFGFVKDYEYLIKKNLAKGASLDNAIAIDDYKIVNEDGLRYPDECVKHKLLDLMGDLYLLGYSMIGSVSACRSGHELNSMLLKALLSDEAAWEIVSHENDQSLPRQFYSFFDALVPDTP